MDETTAEILARMEKFAEALIVVRGYSREHLADIQGITKRLEVAERVVSELWASRYDDGLDGEDIADLLIECGAAKSVTATEPCSEECLCSAAVREFPTGCLRLSQGGG